MSMDFHLSPEQVCFLKKLAEREKGPDHGGTITSVGDEVQQTILAYLLERKEMNKKNRRPMEITLMVVPENDKFWIQVSEKHFTKKSFSIHYFSDDNADTKDPLQSRVDVFISTYNNLRINQELSEISWKRIIFQDGTFSNECDDKSFEILCQLEAEYRWCLTKNSNQQKFVHFLNLGNYGDRDYWEKCEISSLQKGNNKKFKKSIIAKDIKERLEQTYLHFPSQSTSRHFKHISKAQNASIERNVPQFSKEVWNAITSFTRTAYKKLIGPHKQENNEIDLKTKYKALCHILDGAGAGFAMRVWVDVYWAHTTCDQVGDFIPQEEMNSIIERLEKAFYLIECANSTTPKLYDFPEESNNEVDNNTPKNPMLDFDDLKTAVKFTMEDLGTERNKETKSSKLSVG